jgi:hypothetical protein
MGWESGSDTPVKYKTTMPSVKEVQSARPQPSEIEIRARSQRANLGPLEVPAFGPG